MSRIIVIFGFIIMCFGIMSCRTKATVEDNINDKSKYSIVWQDEFDYTGLPDMNKWSFDTVGNEYRWGNDELQYYTSSMNNAKVENGILIITARKEELKGRQYTSARLKTQDKFDFKYGIIEARIKLPYGKGIWPAFWMLGTKIKTLGWPRSGEIDIMEMVGGSNGGDNTVHSTLHWHGNESREKEGKSYTLKEGVFNDNFHVFSVVWNSTHIRGFVDDTEYFTMDITKDNLNEFHDNFYILLNVAVGGNWPGSPNDSTVFPQEMKVDYVRVFKKDE